MIKISKKPIHHPDDITVKYLINRIPDKLFVYLGLPGEFLRNYPVRIIKHDGSEREMDWLALSKTDNGEILINTEFQSYPVDENKIRAIAEYKDYGKIYYNRPVYSVAVIGEGYEKSQREYSNVSTDILKPHYIHMDWRQLSKKLNKLEDKIPKQEQLSESEAIDMIFISMFAPKNHAKQVTEQIIKLFVFDESITGIFRSYIAFALSIMVKKYFNLTSKEKELLKMIEEEYVDRNALRDVVDFELDHMRKSYEKDLEEKNKLILDKNNEIFTKNQLISDKDQLILDKDEEIKSLKEKLKQNGIK